MAVQSISSKELRERFPAVRAGLARGDEYLLIHRSKPIARLEPIKQLSSAKLRVRGGNLRLQANSSQQLTPAYLNRLADQRYE